jgi:hypothetical protein
VGVQVREFSKLDLESLLEDDEFWSKPTLPISKMRCVSQMSNPRAADSDIVLITASDDGKLVAYLGILPDRFCAPDAGLLKFGWLTTWWVDKGSEHRLAATMLLFTALTRYSNRIAVSSFTPDAKRIYDATRRFHECARFEPVYFVLALPPSFRAAATLTRCLSRVKNAFITGWKLRHRGLKLETVTSFDDDLEAFIKNLVRDDPLDRDRSYWEWVLRHPWISTSAKDKADQQRYEFSLFSRIFKQIPLLVRRRGTTIAFLVLTLRDGRLSLKYAYYDPDDIADVAAALRTAVIRINPWLFVCADDAMNIALKSQLPFYLAARKRATVLAYAAFPLSLRSPIHFGIGDSVFT